MNRSWPVGVLVLCAACAAGDGAPVDEPAAHEAAAGDEAQSAVLASGGPCRFVRPGLEDAPAPSRDPVCGYRYLVNGTELRRVDATFDSDGRPLAERSCTDRCTDRSWAWDAAGHLRRSTLRFSDALLEHSYLWASNGLERRALEVRDQSTAIVVPRVSADCATVTWSWRVVSGPALPAMPLKRVEQFDELRRLVRVDVTATDAKFDSTTELRYHANGTLGEKHVTDFRSERRARWDDRGNELLEQLSMVTGDSERTERTFDDQDRLTLVRTERRDTTGHVTYGRSTFTYDGPRLLSERRETWTTDATVPPLLVVVAHQYDVHGRRTASTEDVGGDGVVEGNATWAYDDAGRLTTTVWTRPQGTSEERLDYCGR